ncbi:MAG TPA: hypothetical protein VF331_13835 [Polyangiales bacterium]
MTSDAYPSQIAQYVRARWRALRQDTPLAADAERDTAVIESSAFEQLLSTAYQASLLHEETRPVTFRLLVGGPESLDPKAGPPSGLHRLVFDAPRAYDAHELRRLSPAAKYHRALIGVRRAANDSFEIWGVLHSGPRWLQQASGGRTQLTPDQLLIVRVTGPGRLAVTWGETTLAQVRGGRLLEASIDVCQSAWFAARFANVRAEVFSLFEAEQRAALVMGSRIPLDRELTRIITQQMLKRLVSVMRAAHHGGTVVLIPPNDAASLLAPDSPLRLKYRFADDEGRRRYRALMLASLRVISEGAASLQPRPDLVDWSVYQRCSSPAVAALDEAIFEMSHLIAALADVDGVVLMTQRFELLGFGGEITGQLSELQSVRRALDLEGTTRESESIDGVGTRHRSAYRLCAHLKQAIAIVVSQDGGARFIAWHEGETTYWDHDSADGADI